MGIVLDPPDVIAFTNFPPRHFVDDHELGDVSVSLFTVQLHCAVGFSSLFCVLGQIFCRGQVIGHPMHGNLLGLLECSV